MARSTIITESQKKAIFALIRQAGDLILSAQSSDISAQEKIGSANFVTPFDVEVQNLLITGLRTIFPSASFIAEENPLPFSAFSNGLCFVIDPIDGTTNFIRNYNCSAVSVGLLWNGNVIFGAVFNPYRNEMFYASLNQGAFLNGKRIFVSEHSLDNAIINFGTSP